MKREAYSGATYSVCLPGGAFVAVYKNGWLITDRGEVWFPHGWLLQPDLWYDGRIVGGATDNVIREYVNGQWIPRGTLHAPEGWVYDNHGQLRIDRFGIRYFDEQDHMVRTQRVEPGESDTYAGPPFWEWTKRGDVTVGHGSDGLHDGDPVLIQRDGDVRRQIEAGLGRHVKFRRRGDELAIAFFNATTQEAVHYWLTVDEIAQLPLETFRQQPKPPKPQPPPKPEPTFMPLEPIAPNGKATVARVMREHPEINTRDEATRGRILDYIARALNDGAEKPFGRKARRKDGSDLNTDALVFLRPDGLLEIYDVIDGRTGGAAWIGGKVNPVIRPGENGYWASPAPVDDAPPADGNSSAPPDTTTNPPAASVTTIDLAPILAPFIERIEQLQRRVSELEQKPATPAPAAPTLPRHVGLRSVHGKFVAAEEDGRLIADRPERGPFETFEVVVVD